jgi:hypothetical protein
MPLRDHFRPPLSPRRHWDSFHGRWAAAIADRLNEQLPPRFFAESQAYIAQVGAEVDVATLQSADEDIGRERDGGAATAVWAPAQAILSIPVEQADHDSFGVRVFDEEGGATLVAVVELVNPRNKDRPASRQAFASKCAGHLAQGISVMIVDVVTVRSADFYAQVLDTFLPESPGESAGSMLYAAELRIKPSPPMLETWVEPLAVGENLPVLPLWLTEETALPVDLESEYMETCRRMRISH